MKITYLAPSIIPSRSANSIHVMKMCQAFASSGHEVTLIVPNRIDEMEASSGDIFEFYGVKRCFRIIRVRWYKVKGRDHLFGFLAALKAYSLKPDIVYSRTIAGAYFSAKMGLSTIFESHAPANYSGKISERLFRALSHSNCLIRVVVITHALKEYHEQVYPNLKTKIQVAPDGADPVIHNFRDKISKGNLVFKVGYVGHLYKGRGIDLIIKLADNCPWAEFHLVGGSPGDLEFWKNKTNLGNLRFHGFVPPAKTIEMLTGFDVLLAPYQQSVSTAAGQDTVRWMSPLKIFEYMSTGVPMIASDLPVLREVLSHERTAFLCPPTDYDAWKQSLECLKNNPALGSNMAKNALTDFLKNYTWHARALKVLG